MRTKEPLARPLSAVALSILCVAFAAGMAIPVPDDATDLLVACRSLIDVLSPGDPVRVDAAALEEALIRLSAQERANADLVRVIDGSIAHLTPNLSEGKPSARMAELSAIWIGWCRKRLTEEGAALKASAAGLYSSLVESSPGPAGSEAEQFWRESGQLSRAFEDGAVAAADRLAAGMSMRLARIESLLAGQPEISPARGAFDRCRATWERCEALIPIARRDMPELPVAVEAAPVQGAGNALPRGQLVHCQPGSISGWAWDPDQPERPLAVILRVNGSFAAAGTANLPVYGIAELAGAPSHLHGFLFERFDFPPGENAIEIVAIDADTGEAATIGMGEIAMPAVR